MIRIHANEIFKFIFFGSVTTVFSLFIIFIFFYKFNFNIYFSNLIGYICGLFLNYSFQRKFVFKSNVNANNSLLKYFIGFIIAYLISFSCLRLLMIFEGFFLLKNLVSICIFTFIIFFMSAKIFKNI